MTQLSWGLQVHCSGLIKISKFLKYPSIGCHFKWWSVSFESWPQGSFTLNIKNNRNSVWLSLGSIWSVKIKRFSAVKHICRIMSTEAPEVASSMNVLYLPLYTHLFLESEWSWFELWPRRCWLHALGNLAPIYCTLDCLWKSQSNTWTGIWQRVAENEGRSCIIHQARDYIMQDWVRCPLYVPKAMEIISVNMIR